MMANATRNIKLKFDGETTAGLAAAAAQSRAYLKSVEKAQREYARAVAKAQAEMDAQAKAFADAREKRLAKLRNNLGDALKSTLAFTTKSALGLASLNSGISALSALGSWAVTASGALLLIPGALAAGAAAMVTWKLGADGIKAAFDKVTPTLDALKAKVSGTFKQELVPAVNDLNVILPKTTTHFQGIASAISDTIARFTGMLRAKDNTDALNGTLDNSAGIIRNVGKALAPLGQAFLDIAQVGSGALNRLTGGVGGLAQRFADFIRQAKESGKLDSWIQGGIDAFKDLWSLLKDVGSIVSSVFSALREGGAGVAPILGPAIQTVKDFVQSPQGQETFRSLGEVLAKVGDAVSRILGPALNAVGPLIGPLADLLGSVASTLADYLGPALEELGQILKPVFEALSPVVKQLIEGLAPIIPAIVQALGPFAAALILLAPIILALNIPLLLGISALTAFVQLITGDVQGALNTMSTGWENANKSMATITDTNWGGMANSVLTSMSGITDTVATKGSGMQKNFGSALMGMQGSTASGFSNIMGSASSGMGGMNGMITAGLDTAVKWLATLPIRAIQALGDLGGKLVQSGASLIGGFIRGITSKIGDVLSAVGGMLGKVRNLFPFSPAKEGPFSGKGWTLYSGMSITESIADGISANTSKAVQSARNMVSAISAAIPGQMNTSMKATAALTGSVASPGLAARAAQAQALSGALSDREPINVALDLDLGEGITQRVDISIDKNNRAIARLARTGAGGYR